MLLFVGRALNALAPSCLHPPSLVHDLADDLRLSDLGPPVASELTAGGLPLTPAAANGSSTKESDRFSSI